MVRGQLSRCSFWRCDGSRCLLLWSSVGRAPEARVAVETGCKVALQVTRYCRWPGSNGSGTCDFRHSFAPQKPWLGVPRTSRVVGGRSHFFLFWMFAGFDRDTGVLLPTRDQNGWQQIVDDFRPGRGSTNRDQPADGIAAPRAIPRPSPTSFCCHGAATRGRKRRDGAGRAGKPWPCRPLMSLQDRELFEVFDLRDQGSSPVRSAT